LSFESSTAPATASRPHDAEDEADIDAIPWVEKLAKKSPAIRSLGIWSQRYSVPTGPRLWRFLLQRSIQVEKPYTLQTGMEGPETEEG
jgi:hypothetical protein